jgi:hypothetical protein
VYLHGCGASMGHVHACHECGNAGRVSIWDAACNRCVRHAFHAHWGVVVFLRPVSAPVDSQCMCPSSATHTRLCARTHTHGHTHVSGKGIGHMHTHTHVRSRERERETRTHSERRVILTSESLRACMCASLRTCAWLMRRCRAAGALSRHFSMQSHRLLACSASPGSLH